APVTLATPRLTLREAIDVALANDPALHLAREQVTASRGSLLMASGAFDTVLAVAPAFEHQTSAVGRPGMRNQELLRNLSREIATTFRLIADDLRRQLDLQGNIPLIQCPPGLVITIGGEPVCLSNRQRAQWEIIEIITRRPELEPQRRTLEEAARRRAEQIALILDITALASRGLLRTMGVRATLEDRTSIELQLSAAKLYRNGVAVTPLLGFSGSKDNYRGKRLDPTYGGKGNLNTFTSIAGLSLEVPLGKGRGEAATGAAERAGRLNLAASLESEAHAVAGTVLRTLLAYLELAAAQERLELFMASEQRQAFLVAMGEALQKAGELAEADLITVRARLASTRTTVAQAWQSVAEARIALAEAMGVAVEQLEEAPLAAETLPPPPAESEVDAWRQQQRAQAARARRADLRAAHRLEESARELAEAARLDLRRSSTLSFQAWYQGLWEGKSPRDMRNVLVGWERALFGGQVGPSARLLLTVEWPFANNVARGRYLEARALYHSGGIQARNLERVIAGRVEELVGAVLKARTEVARGQAAVELYDQLIEAEVERFRLGEATAADLVLTEENRIGAALALVTARQRLAAAVAQLRFELGTLVRYRISDQRVVVEEILPATG
ncbi:MAG: TolC family protein, partial [Acidobacteriota bacterium]